MSTNADFWLTNADVKHPDKTRQATLVILVNTFQQSTSLVMFTAFSL